MLPIYVVSLKRDMERRIVIQQKMDQLNIPFEFIDAVVGKSLPEDALNNIRQKKSGILLKRQYDATPGEIGCSLSHLHIYQMIQKDNNDWVCILEDDVILDERFSQFYLDFHNHQKHLNPNNLYLLGGQNGLEHPLVFKSYVRKVTIGQQTFVKTIESEEYIYRTCCYLMSRSMAGKMIALSDKEFFIADDWAYLSQQKIIHAIYLANFVDHPLDLSDSSIEQERLSNIQGIQVAPIEQLSFMTKVKNKLSWKLKVLWLNISRFL